MDYVDKVFNIFMTVLVVVFFLFLAAGFVWGYEGAFIHPIAAENATQICIERGFDHAESFRRVLFSTEPLAIKCGIVEKMKVNIDGGVPLEVIE